MRNKTVKKQNKRYRKRGGMDLEKGPVDMPLQRIRTTEMGPNPTTREKFERKVREDQQKHISAAEVEAEFARGPPEERERRERNSMSDEDSREDPFLARMDSWGKYEKGGRKSRKNKRKTRKTRSKSRKNTKKRV